MSAPTATATPPRIGVFDSGLGGLSVLRAIRARLPDHDLLYVADSGHAPYGDRGDAYVVERTRILSDFLLGEGADCLVIACNTATTAAVSSLRQAHPRLAIVGVEPGIKPAATLTRNQRVGVMATTGTLRSEKFRLLAQAHAAHLELVLQPCPGLADGIERGDLDDPALLALIGRHVQPLKDAGVDTVVLGCTHYVFVAHHIQAALGPGVRLVDTAEAVARQTAVLAGSVCPSQTPRAPVRLWTSGSTDTLQRVTDQWLGWTCLIDALPSHAR